PEPAPAPEPSAASTAQPAPAPAPEPAFAPPAPAPQATAPQAGFPHGVHGAPGAPGGPVPPAPVWGAGYGAGPWGVPVPAANGLAVAALVTGIAGVIGGLLPFFFFMGGLLALTAAGLGIGAIVRASNGAGRQAMAITGTALGVLGIGASIGGFVLTGVVLDRASERAQHRVHEEEWGDPGEDDEDFGDATPAPPAPKPSPSQVPGMTAPLPFGETYTYPNGIKVTLSVPKKYVTKNRYLEVGNAVQMTITITNNSTESHNVIYAVPNVRDEQRMTAKLVFDGELPKTIKGDILPGESASGVVAFEVPEGTGRLTADISPGTRLPNAKFSGPIG
ncbi:DUF4190 domain-containing protein, partial [Streptomyces sp. NPDC044571]|uniref:DUF4190 domain-containing protein n=1 Tax=Streptomyces sp. NPDC044571 TaxID=3155371 RepID=UPI0033F2A0AD